MSGEGVGEPRQAKVEENHVRRERNGSSEEGVGEACQDRVEATFSPQQLSSWLRE